MDGAYGLEAGMMKVLHWGQDQRGRVSLAVVALVGAIVSLVITGYLFPKGNGLFYYAIISNVASDAHLKDDVFVQSLNYFSSGFWLALRGAPKYVNPYWMFLGFDLVSRILTFVGALYCAELFGVKSFSQRLVFSLIFAASFLMSDASLAGGGGLFIDNFTHTELDNGLFLLCLGLAVRGRIGLSIAILGLIGFVNAFFAIWVVFPLAAIVALQLWSGEARPSRLAAQTLAGGLVAAALAIPVVLSLTQNPSYGSAINFDYVTYLYQYYPYHFLFDSMRLPEKVGLLLVVATVFLSFALLGGFAQYFIAATIATIVVYIFGIIVPHVTHSQAILNLHLLRSSALFHILGALSTSALAVVWLFDEDRHDAMLKGPVLAFILTFPTMIRTMHAYIYGPVCAALFVFMVFVTTASWFGWSGPDVPSAWANRGAALRTAGVAWLGLAIAAQAIAMHWAQAVERERIADWRRVAEWARANTPQDSTFLNPVEQGRENAVFDAVAHRSVWVDWKRGAAVLWYPTYYLVWRRRMDETDDLVSLDSKIGYAASRHIRYVVELCSAGDSRATPSSAVFTAGKLCVWDVSGLRRD